MSFIAKEDGFYLNDQKVFLNSGEIHYFRLNRGLWETHLQAAKEAGLNTISTYVPWDWHEQYEGSFDFEGGSSSNQNLKLWLDMCKDHGLYCILKPGPFILAEYRGAGLPQWFMDEHGDEIRMRNSKGERVMSDGVNIFHPKFIEKVKLWYDHVIPFIAQNQISEGGPVIMMQLCNEIGVFSWLAHQADYGVGVRERFVKHLKGKYSSVDEVNSLWSTTYASFEEIELPPDGALPYQSKGDRARDYEWHSFWRVYYAEYLQMLKGIVREKGLKVPLYHNLPGWIYGHGYEFPLNITMYQELYGSKSDILFGVDHIPEFVSFRNMHDDRIINDITRAVRGAKPLFAAEFQSGSREYQVVPSPREMELFYKASIINGLKGWNYYMFSQGFNPERKGYSGSFFYWYTPLSVEGFRSPAFDVVKKMSSILAVMQDIILRAEHQAEVCVLFYPPYYATELERPETGASDLRFVPSAVRRHAYFDGLLRVFQVLNIEYEMVDLTQTSVDELLKYRQVWLFSTDEMDAHHQQLVVDYAEKGGHLAIFPYLPDREMRQNRCKIIREALNVEPQGFEVIDSPLIDVLNLRDIKCANPQVTYSKDQLEDAEIIAQTLQGSICGFIKPLGKGKVLHLGTWLGFETEYHKNVYEGLINKLGAPEPMMQTSSDSLVVRQRNTPAGEGLLFVGNYHNHDQKAIVEYTHPKNNEQIKIPYSFGNEIVWPSSYGLLIPICLNIAEGFTILHTTSDILRVEVHQEHIDIHIWGHRDLMGELLLEGGRVETVKGITLDDKSRYPQFYPQRMLFTYEHKHNTEMLIRLSLT